MNRADYNVGGVISPRPFRMRRLGHIGGVVCDGFQEGYASERFDSRQVAGSGVTLSMQRSAAEVEE